MSNCIVKILKAYRPKQFLNINTVIEHRQSAMRNGICINTLNCCQGRLLTVKMCGLEQKFANNWKTSATTNLQEFSVQI